MPPCHLLAPPSSLFRISALAAALSWSLPGLAASAVPDEQSFLGEMPVVLSVSRLAQPLAEAPAR